MRVMLDTNVLISMILFPGMDFKRILKNITESHTLVLSSFVITELKNVADRKFPHKRKDIDRFLAELSYELVYTPDYMDHSLFKIRDINDYPVLYSAIISDVDILITGDADFFNIEIDHPKIINPRGYIDSFCK